MMAILLVMAASQMAACQPKPKEPTPDLSDDVFELAIRRVNPGQSLAGFTAARDAFVAKLMAEAGTSNDREVQPFFDFLGTGLPLDSVYIGMTQYQDAETFAALGQSLAGIPEAAPFMGAFTPLVFEALQPIAGYGPVDLSTVAPLGSGQVLEIAVRDLSAYANLDQADYEAKRDAFLALLAQQPGFVQEIQWQSILNPTIVVGMTVYESQAAVTAINSDPAFVQSEEAMNFIGSYPPTVFGMLNTVLK
ncbi:MAG: hypothetical protein D6722_28085 [Bacteroidetes bacterium]|nr:MAG: hypothetical protein D6722_28085 [Bacteroidota bacterium]